MLLKETTVNISSDTTVLKSSDEFDWSSVNVSVIDSRPYENELIHGGGGDLWIWMTMDPLEMQIFTHHQEFDLSLRPHQIGIHSPFTVFGTIRRNESRLLHVFLKNEMLSEVLGELFDCDIGSLENISKIGFTDHDIARVLCLMQRSLFEPADYCALKMEYLARVLAIDAFSRYLSLPSRESEARLKRRLSAHQIRRVLDYIQEHLASNITLNDLANVAGLNRTLFIQHFKASLKATPHQYLIQTRIRQARRLISSSKLPFVDIALRCGFADQAHFSRCFRKVVGVTPSAYRWQNR